MAFIQCSLTGTALSWYIRLNDTYKQDWHVFVQAFKKQFSSQKNAYYAQVEALSLIKKDNETVRHFALRVQQLVEKGWCNENASTINLKCNEIFTKGLPKNLKDFANKRQVKHTSTILEPSIPFTDEKPDICATIIQNSTNHIATLPTGHIGYIEVPITNEKPRYYQVNDLNTLIHNVTQTYHPEITELIPPTNYSTTTAKQTIFQNTICTKSSLYDRHQFITLLTIYI